jgi:hypothetical protein
MRKCVWTKKKQTENAATQACPVVLDTLLVAGSNISNEGIANASPATGFSERTFFRIGSMSLALRPSRLLIFRTTSSMVDMSTKAPWDDRVFVKTSDRRARLFGIACQTRKTLAIAYVCELSLLREVCFLLFAF